MRHILEQNSPVLRQIAKEVPIGEINGNKIQSILADMHEALAAEYDGVGLAAPQIGESLRIFIVSELAYKKDDVVEIVKTADDAQNADNVKNTTNETLSEKSHNEKKESLVFINPEITKASKDKKALEEGCLSVRPLYGKVRRASKVSICAYDETGRRFERGASGLLAQVFQHELDHLNGVLFIDKAKNIHEMDVEENKRAIVAKNVAKKKIAK